jgi:hypothetical protein
VYANRHRQYGAHALLLITLMSRPFALVVVLCFVGGIAMSAQDRIPVYIEAGDPAAPFSDPALKDSAKDISKYLKGKKLVRLTDTREESTVVIRVIQRASAPAGGSVIVAPAPNMAFAIPTDNTTVRANIMVGDFVHELSAAGEGSWGLAAKRLAQQIERWLQENQARLR